jgi:sugar phosphate permease
MQIGILASAAALLLSITTLLPLILACGFLLGVGYGPNTPGAAHILARVTRPKDRPLVFSIKQSGAPLGGFVAGLLIPWVVVGAGWREALMVSAALGVVTVLMVQPLRARSDDDRQPGRPLSIGGVWRQLRLFAGHPGLRRLTLAGFIFACVQSCMFAFLVTYLVIHVGLDLVSAGLAYSCMHGIGVGARIAWGWLAGRFFRAAVVLAVLGMASASFVVMLAHIDASWPFWSVAAVSAAVGATAAGWNGVFIAEITRVAPADQISAATGGSIFFTYFGLVVGPAVFSVLVTVSNGYMLPYYVIAGAIFLAALSILPRRQRPSLRRRSS